jgi:hypothetical protein
MMRLEKVIETANADVNLTTGPPGLYRFDNGMVLKEVVNKHSKLFSTGVLLFTFKLD